MKCEYGICTLCEKSVMETCSTCGAKRHAGRYTEVLLDLTNGSKMPVAVCLDCKDHVHQVNKKVLMDAVRQGWHREHVKANWSKEKRDAYWARHGEGILEIA